MENPAKFHPVILWGDIKRAENSLLPLLERYGKTKLVFTRDLITLGMYLKALEKQVAYPNVLVVTDVRIEKVGANIIDISSFPVLIGPLAGKEYGYYDGDWHACTTIGELKDKVPRNATALWTPQGTTYNFPSVLGHHLSCNGECEDKCWW
jgi:hypothetical protein